MAKQYNAQQMIEAIRDANGVLAVAARKLGCSRTTVHKYVNEYATVRDAYEEANESNIDMVEGYLMKNIQGGNVAAQIFFLKTKGKHRGYVERQEVTGADGGPQKVIVEYADSDPA